MKPLINTCLGLSAYLWVACSPSANVPTVDMIPSNRANAEEEEDEEPEIVPIMSEGFYDEELAASEERIAELSKTLESLSKQIESQNQMDEATKKQLEAEIEEQKKAVAAEQAKRAEIEKAAAAAKAAADAAAAAGQKSGKLALVYGTDCLDIVGQSTVDGAPLRAFPCGAATSQQFMTETVAPNSFRLVNLGSMKCIVVENASTAEGARLVQQTCKRDGSLNELFSAVGGTPPAAAKFRGGGSQLCLKTGTNGLVFQGNCANNFTMYSQRVIN